MDLQSNKILKIKYRGAGYNLKQITASLKPIQVETLHNYIVN